MDCGRIVYSPNYARDVNNQGYMQVNWWDELLCFKRTQFLTKKSSETIFT